MKLVYNSIYWFAKNRWDDRDDPRSIANICMLASGLLNLFTLGIVLADCCNLVVKTSHNMVIAILYGVGGYLLLDIYGKRVISEKSVSPKPGLLYILYSFSSLFLAGALLS